MKALFLISCLLIVSYADFEFSDITNLGNTIVDGVVSAEKSVENLAKEGVDTIGNAIKDGVNYVTGESKPAETPQAVAAVEPTLTPISAIPISEPPVLVADRDFKYSPPLVELTAVPLMIRGIPVTSENMVGVAESMNQQVELIEAKAAEKIQKTETSKDKESSEQSTSEDIEEKQKKQTTHHKESLKIEKKEGTDAEKVKKHAKDMKDRSEGKEHEHKQMKEGKMSHEEWKQKKEAKAAKMKSYHEKHHEESKKERHDRKQFTSEELVEMWAKKHYKVPKTDDKKLSTSESKDSLSMLSIPIDLEIHTKFSTSNLRNDP